MGFTQIDHSPHSIILPQGCITMLEDFFRQHFVILAVAALGVAGVQVSNAVSSEIITCIITYGSSGKQGYYYESPVQVVQAPIPTG